MKKIYIDFTHSLPTKTAKFHGGGNYTKTLLLDLKEYLIKEDENKEIIILFPADYKNLSEVEKEILSFEKYKIVYTDVPLDKVEFEKDSILFLPLLGVKEFPILKRVKGKNQIELVLTIHGLRLLDMKWDKYDLAYLNSLKDKIVYIIKNKYLLHFRKTIYRYYLRQFIPFCDKLITVSNYSLSSIAKYAHPKSLYLQYENIRGSHNINKNMEKEDYILFVSGNRPEKNLARTLDAYKTVYNRNSDVLPLYITGTSKEIQKNLSESLGLSDLIMKKNIVFLDYVSDEQLANLYENAAFLLYTSKSEGFGLPALEACRRNCPIVAAYGTSIPEVLGGHALYVDPYTLESIAYGIQKMNDLNIRKSYSKKIEKMLPYIEDKIEQSNAALFEFILG